MATSLRYVRRESVLVPAVCFFIGAAGLYLMSDDGVPAGIGAERIGTLLAAALFFIAGVRALTMRLLIAPDGVTLRNLFRTRRWKVTDVCEVGKGRYRFIGLPSVALRLESGDVVNITALQPPNRAIWNDDVTSRLIDEANLGLARAKNSDADPE